MNQEAFLIYACAMASAYLIGSIPFGFLIGRLRGVDVRTVGSKNIGATNVYRTVGHGWGILAFVCDFLKGFVPTTVASHLCATHAQFMYVPLAVGVMCVVGHMWTCFMHFKGGKGVATGFGMLMGLIPFLVLAAFALFVVTVWLSHYISLGSILAATFLLGTIWFPILGTPGTANLPQCLVVSLVAVCAILKHKSNIVRLTKGCENKIY